VENNISFPQARQIVTQQQSTLLRSSGSNTCRLSATIKNTNGKPSEGRNAKKKEGSYSTNDVLLEEDIY